MSNFFKKSQDNQEYLLTKINPLMERLYKDMIVEKPVEPVNIFSFFIEFIQHIIIYFEIQIEYIISWMQKEKLGQNKTRVYTAIQRSEVPKNSFESSYKSPPQQSQPQTFESFTTSSIFNKISLYIFFF